MKLNQSKLDRQSGMINDWIGGGGKGTVQAVTGFGKSFVGVLLIRSMNEKQPNNTTVIVVPTLYLKQQWEELILDHKLHNVDVMVINTAIKQEISVDFLILDEIHRYAADTFKRVFGAVKYSYILGLTATLERQDLKHTLLERYCPIIAQVEMTEALEKKFVSDFATYNLGIKADSKFIADYNVLNNKFNQYFAIFNHDFPFAMRCLKDDHACRSHAQYLNWDAQRVKVGAINFMRTMQKRKKMLYEAAPKLEAAKQIIDKLPNMYTIIFSQTTAQADAVAEYLGDIATTYHSKITPKQLKLNMKRFNDKRTKVRVLSTAKALDEGLNIEGIGCAIILAGNSTTRQAVQRTGRAIRYKEGKQAIIFNLFIENTKEEHWLRLRQKGMPNINWITNVEDIDYETRRISTNASGSGDFDLFKSD